MPFGKRLTISDPEEIRLLSLKQRSRLLHLNILTDIRSRPLLDFINPPAIRNVSIFYEDLLPFLSAFTPSIASSNDILSSNLAKCPTLKGKENYTEWAEMMKSNLETLGCWDLVTGDERLVSRPDPFYTSRNRPSSVATLRTMEPGFAQRSRAAGNRAGTYTHSDEACKETIQEIKTQVEGYEDQRRLLKKAINMIMDAITKDLWHQCTNKEDPAALWTELYNNYHRAGAPELNKELAKFAEMTLANYPNPPNPPQRPQNATCQN